MDAITTEKDGDVGKMLCRDTLGVGGAHCTNTKNEVILLGETLCAKVVSIVSR